MNIWDSVHRGLEKASHEAARIAKAQKLRTQIDGLSRQFTTQQATLLNRTMELFRANQLTQSQLLPICNELANLQQQLEQAQNELKQLQNQGVPQTSQPPATQVDAMGTYQIGAPYPAGELPPTIYAPPPPGSDYQPQTEKTVPAVGSNPQTVSAMETLLLGVTPTPPPPPTIPITIHCAGCQGEITSGLAYCPNCGKAVQESTFAHLPTMRGGTLEPFYAVGQETERGTGPGHIADQQTVRSEPPPAENPAKEQDGGS